jgi:hypothetical protein
MTRPYRHRAALARPPETTPKSSDDSYRATEIRETIYQVRGASDGDAGEVRYGHYEIKDGRVYLVNKQGARLTAPDGTHYCSDLQQGQDARHLAATLLRRTEKEKPAFNRRLSYPNNVYV